MAEFEMVGWHLQLDGPDKEDVIAALDAGATAISSTNQQVWKL